jgi:hypothetical protein
MPSGILLFFLAVELIVGTLGLLLLIRERRLGDGRFYKERGRVSSASIRLRAAVLSL